MRKIYLFIFLVSLCGNVFSQTAIENKNEKVAFIHKIGTKATINDAICWNFIISAKEGKPLYYDYHKIDSDNPDAFLAKDFKNIAK